MTTLPVAANLCAHGTTAPLRILLVSSSSGSHGGGEFYLLGLAEGLRALGVQVASLVSTHPRMDGMAQLLSPWGPVHRLPFRNTYDKWLRCGADVLGNWGRGLTPVLRQLSPDVIHVNKQNVEDGLNLLLDAERTGIPVVSTVHITRSMVELGTRGGRFRDWLAARVLRQARCEYIAISQSCAGQLRAFQGGAIPAPRIHTVPNGVTAATVADRARLRAEWGCTTNEVVLGCVARIEAQKNPLFVVELLKSLPEYVHLVWVGDGSLRSQLEQAAVQRGVRRRLHLDGWQADARARLAGFDVFVLPSLYEGLPLAALEGLAAGLPCVVSDVDGNREAVIAGHNGWLCGVNERATWIDRLMPLVSEAALRQQMGRASLLRYQQHFTLEAMAQRTLEVYHQALAKAAGRRRPA